MSCIAVCVLLASVFAQELEPSKASFEEPKRLLLLDGSDGIVACRIYGDLMSGTVPRLSDNGTLEFATRAWLRLRNLIAVRGVPGASMVGPADYLGNLEDPHKYLYTIQEGSPPVFYRRALSGENTTQDGNLKPFDESVVTVVGTRWISGKQRSFIQEKQSEYQISSAQSEHSLFPDPGILEIDRPLVELRWFDPREVDLSSFKARLVNNKIPFQITHEKLPSNEEYRLITYFYEAGYAKWQIESGSGLFLETHHFSQTITPMSVRSGGFVVLARWNAKGSQNVGKLELIGVRIPYGYTLIIDSGCIHGDTTLNGFFLMGMTSDHTVMRTADTVFLKCPQNKGNGTMVMRGQEEAANVISWDTHSSLEMPPPYVIYNGATQQDIETFKRMTAGKSFIFNPLSRAYWR